MAEVPRIIIDELKKRMDRGEPILLIDARNSRDWGESGVRLPGAIRMPVGEVEQNLDKLPRDRLTVAYCT